jgi:hypothetical protein
MEVISPGRLQSRLENVMKLRRIIITLALLVAGIMGAAPSLRAQETGQRRDRIRVTVTLHGTKENPHPQVTREDVLVFQERDRRPVLGWTSAKGNEAGLDLAILVDDSLDSPIGNQFGDLAEFIRGLPSTARVAVAYASFGRAKKAQDFTTDHEKAVKALRIPMGSMDASTSIFQAAGELASHWPAGTNRREVLLISDGIDTYYGISESQAGQNPSLQQAIDKAQRNGVTIFAIYASGAGHFQQQLYLINNGRSCLSRLAVETGGEAYFQGFETPISFKPFLGEISGHLENQYVLTFGARTGQKAGYQHLHLRSEINGIEFLGPDRVYIPATR